MIYADGMHGLFRLGYGAQFIHVAAAMAEDRAKIDELLACGADPDARDAGGCTPLHYAAWNNPVGEVAAALFEAGADVEACDGHLNVTSDRRRRRLPSSGPAASEVQCRSGGTHSVMRAIGATRKRFYGRQPALWPRHEQEDAANRLFDEGRGADAARLHRGRTCHPAVYATLLYVR